MALGVCHPKLSCSFFWWLGRVERNSCLCVQRTLCPPPLMNFRRPTREELFPALQSCSPAPGHHFQPSLRLWLQFDRAVLFCRQNAWTTLVTLRVSAELLDSHFHVTIFQPHFHLYSNSTALFQCIALVGIGNFKHWKYLKKQILTPHTEIANKFALRSTSMSTAKRNYLSGLYYLSNIMTNSINYQYSHFVRHRLHLEMQNISESPKEEHSHNRLPWGMGSPKGCIFMLNHTTTRHTCCMGHQV